MKGRPHRDRPKVLKKLFTVATVSQVAEWVNRSPSTVSAWIQVPAEHAHTLELRTGIPKSVLRPDLWR